MAVTSVKLNTKGWTGRTDAEYNASVTVNYLVDVSTEYDGPETVLAQGPAFGLPVRGSQYGAGNDSAPALYAQEFTVSPFHNSGSHGRQWQVAVTYSTLGDKDPGDFVENPLARPAKFGVEFEDEEVAVLKTLDGTLIKNKAGDPFNPPAATVLSRPIILAEKNYANLATVITAHNVMSGILAGFPYGARNSAAWNGFSAGVLRYLGPRVGDLSQVNGYSFYPVTWRFTLNDKGSAWKLDLVEQGNRVLDVAGGDPVPPRDKKDGHLLATPVRLADDGTLLESTQDNVVTSFDVYPPVDYASVLGF